MIRAAGILCVARTGHVLFLRRTDGQGWAFPGGHIEDGESPEDAARREFQEETGQKCSSDIKLWTRRVLGDVDFSTFICKCDDMFTPVLDQEHDRWQWVDREFALNAPGLHPGCLIALRRFSMDELDIAKAIQAGELTSPQRYGDNLMLIAIRITGTGVAYRGMEEGFPFRDPALYLTPEFVQRCNGLPVIFEHPEDSLLNTEEFRERIVGTVFLPYIQADEVWGIAKILDMEVAEVLETEKMSTSPAVLCGGKRLPLEGGSTVLIESKPSLLDHIAICPRGVWDKLGPPAGVDCIDTRADSLGDLDLVYINFKLDQLTRRLARSS